MRRLHTHFALDLADNVQRTLYLTGTYEPEFLRFLQSELQPGDVYADIGAHVGIDAVVAARCVGSSGHVYAFEPAPDTVRRLREATSSSGNVTVVDVALGSTTATVALRADPLFPPGDASTRSLFTDGAIICQIPMTTFDVWSAALKRLDVVKIDIEGGEFDAIAGMTGALSRFRPRAIIVELQAARLRIAGYSDRDIVQLLLDNGYSPSKEMFLDNHVFRRSTASPT